jgi:hypothetical protein
LLLGFDNIHVIRSDFTGSPNTAHNNPVLRRLTSSSAFSDGQFYLNDEHCRLLELLQVAKQLLLTWTLAPFDHITSLKVARFGHLVRTWSTVIGSVLQGHVALTDSKLLVQMML